MTPKNRTDDEIGVALVCPKCGRWRTKMSESYLICLPCNSRLYRNLSVAESATRFVGTMFESLNFIARKAKIALRHGDLLHFLSKPQTTKAVTAFRGKLAAGPLLAHLVHWELVEKRSQEVGPPTWQAVANGEPEKAEGD